MNEFGLIRRYFAGLAPAGQGVALGIGDDCALLEPPHGRLLAVTSDTLVAGRHFPESSLPRHIGWKALAVNLSDLAAMGAQPLWFTLALSLGEADARWLEDFSSGLGALAAQAQIALIGGDTTRGPLSITITALGSVPPGAALQRSGAQPGDAICVTGTLGDAALGLQLLNEFQAMLDDRAELAQWEEEEFQPQPETGSGLRGRLAEWLAAPRRARFPQAALAVAPIWTNAHQWLRNRLDRPQPRVAAGIALRGLAHAAIDLSDGLAGDLRHLLEASGVGAEVRSDRLPMSAAFAKLHPKRERLRLQAAGGDDYELCVCVPPQRLAQARARLGDLPLTEIGRITRKPGLRWLDARGRRIPVELHGYEHFR